MYLESLLRLAQILDEFEKRGEKLISTEFHTDTEELLKKQSEYLVQELQYLKFGLQMKFQIL